MEPYQYKTGSREQGNVRKKRADALNLISTKNIFFRVNARALSEMCTLLISHQTKY